MSVEQQRYNNCGPEVIENFIYYLTGVRAAQEAAVYVHSLLLENTLLDPVEYALKIAENHKVVGFLSNQTPITIGKPIITGNFLETFISQVSFEMPLLAVKTDFGQSSQIQYLKHEVVDHIKQINIQHANSASRELVAIVSDYGSYQQSFQKSGIFPTFIYTFTDTIVNTFNHGFMSVGSPITKVVMQNNHIKHKLINYVYHDELSAINNVINQPYIQSSTIPGIQSVLQKHPSQWTKSDFKKINLVVHPDKGGNNEDFNTVNAFQKQIKDNDQMYQNFLPKLLPIIQTMIHKANIGFKVLDTSVDAVRLIYEPTLPHFKKIALDSTYIYSMYYGFNSYSSVVGTVNVLQLTIQEEYTDALKQAVITVGYMALPTLLAYTGIPYVGLAYGVSMVAYTGYNAITNAYSFYQDNSSESVLQSFIAYKDLTKTLSESPLQQIYDFTAMAKGYEVQINDIALTQEKKVLKAKLTAEKGEFGQKLYDYIYEPSLTEKYKLLNQLLQGNITEEQAEALKAEHIKISSPEQSYDHCLEFKNAESNNETIEYYYCYNEEQQILDHILISENNIEIIERL